MDRKEMIDRLVSRKLATKGLGKVFCICFAQVTQTAQPGVAPKK